MGMYWTCPDCGAHLDHGEQCDCRKEKNKKNSQVCGFYAVTAHKTNKKVKSLTGGA